MSKEIIVFTDGACKDNGSSHAKGSSAALFPNGEIKGGAYNIPDSEIRTNNRQEYYAAIKAMELVNEYNPDNTLTIHIYTDSKLLIDTCTKWMNSWHKNGWEKRSSGEIKNLDLVKTLYKYCQDRTVKWTHVKAHQFDDSFETTWNNRVDLCASNATYLDKMEICASDNSDDKYEEIIKRLKSIIRDVEELKSTNKENGSMKKKVKVCNFDLNAFK